MKAKEIIKIIENICPERLAYSWDNEMCIRDRVVNVDGGMVI